MNKIYYINVCYMLEITSDIDSQLSEFGCEDFKDISKYKPIVRGEWIECERTKLVPTGECSINEFGNPFMKRKHIKEKRYKCNQCELISDNDTPFCPYCSADMRGNEND